MSDFDDYGLNNHEVRHLLAIAMSYDNRKPSDAAVLSWTEASRRGRWTFVEAQEAMNAHYAESTEFAMPAHVAQRVKAARQDAALRKPVDPPDKAGQERLAKMISGAFRDVNEPAPLELAKILTVVCARCHAPIGKQCMNPVTGRKSRVPCLARICAVDEVPA